MGEYALDNARRWNADGTNFAFVVRCFNVEYDSPWILDQLNGKRLLLISDIRGANLFEDGVTFDKACDQNVQWQAIERLRPESSLVKFAAPNMEEQFFRYAPGKVLKQAFDNYGACEVRLMIAGTPQRYRRYNAWEIFETPRTPTWSCL